MRFNLMVSLSMAALGSGNHWHCGHVVMRDEMILVFDSEQDAQELDTRYCYNAVADTSTTRHLKSILAEGRQPRIVVKIAKGFFHREQWGPNIIGHPVYQGRSVQDFCERADLIIIQAAD